MSRIRTLIVDDSALVRMAVRDSLAQDPEIEVVGAAADPYEARDKILELNPDVLTLDIEMPRMDGLTFLRLLMKHHPLPVVIMSSLTASGSTKVLEALQAGAVDVIGKPNGHSSAAAEGHLLAQKIKAAAQAILRPASVVQQPPSAGAPPEKLSYSQPPGALRRIVLIGASTGGTEAIKTILTALRPERLPGICIVQHIPAYFSAAFANRLNELCRIEVREAKTGDRVLPGLALVAPGGYHMLLRRSGGGYTVEMTQGPMVHHQRPAVEVLFDSALKAGAGPHALAMVLTGMGGDGAAGLLNLRQAGAATLAQNQESCVVFGMPQEAIRLGGAQEVLPLQAIARRIERFAAEVTG